jgi:peptide-methionine (S)-S-oxide reductase
MKKNLETAVFGGGCFWCTEAVFQSLKGVTSVTPGYAGGAVDDPNYIDVSQGNTGHAEVIRLEFDPKVISYDDLLEIFWNVHNPTSLNRQGNDVGEQYRSVILYTTDSQKGKAEMSKKKLGESGQYESPIVTEIEPLDIFFEAEGYHKNYYINHKDDAYCEIVINPKLEKLKLKFSKFIGE